MCWHVKKRLEFESVRQIWHPLSYIALNRQETALNPFCSPVTHIFMKETFNPHGRASWVISSPEHSSSELLWRNVRRPSVRQLFTSLTSSQERRKVYTPNFHKCPYEVPTKCCYFSSRSEIQYGRPALWLPDTFWTFSQERLKGSTTNLPQMFLMRSQPSVVTFQVAPKSNMAALPSDLLTHFELFLKNGWRDLLQTWHKCSLWYLN